MISEKEKEKIQTKKRSKNRRTNAKLYPIYKGFAWDLLCYYSIEYLFLTMTKGILPSQVLIISAVYTLSKLILQIPSIIISEYLGKKKSILLGNSLVLISVIWLMLSPNFIWVLLSQLTMAMGYDIKAICDSNLLYDSVATKGGDGLYAKLETKGGSGYYLFDAILSIMAGYLFVINNYIPMTICSICLLIAIIIASRFKDIYPVNKEKRKPLSKFAIDYKDDIISSLKFIKRSKRIKAYLIFAGIFYGTIRIFDVYKSNLLTELEVSPEIFSIIVAVLSLLAAISVRFAKKIQSKFKNRTLSFISLTYLISWITIGVLSLKLTNSVALPIILGLYCVNRICDSQWYIVKERYLRNFTEPETRGKITFTFEFISSLAGSLAALIGAAILSVTTIKYAILLVALLMFAIIVVVLDYMKSRFGLKPKQYDKEDLQFKL